MHDRERIEDLERKVRMLEYELRGYKDMLKWDIRWETLDKVDRTEFNALLKHLDLEIVEGDKFIIVKKREEIK